MEQTQNLVKKSAQLKFTDLSKEEITLVKHLALDYFAVIGAGLSHAKDLSTLVCNYASHFGAKPESSIIGTSLKTEASLAAMANGTIAHALDFDDGNIFVMGHPSAVLFSALLGLAQPTGKTGADVIKAYIAGIEVMITLGKVLTRKHPENGWHTTSTIGALGASIACGSLLGVAPEVMERALGLAASMAGGLRHNFGSMTKPLHIGLAARNGIMATQLAAMGFTSSNGVLEGGQGFIRAFGQAGYNESLFKNISVDAGREFATSPRFVKQYPSCGGTHSPVDAILNLRRSQTFQLTDVERILVYVSGVVRRTCFYDNPRTPMEGKFSMQYCVAAALKFGALDPEHFSDSCFFDKDVQALMSRVTVVVDDALYVPEAYPATVEISLKSGKTLTEKVYHTKGHLKLPMEEKDFIGKFNRNWNVPSKGRPKETLVERILQFEKLKNMDELLALTTP